MYRCLRYWYRYDYLASSAAANTMTVLVAALEYAPALEIDQTISNNSYYVTLNGFMPFLTWGPRKYLNEDPAGHPKRNTYQLIPFSTPVKSRQTVPLRKSTVSPLSGLPKFVSCMLHVVSLFRVIFCTLQRVQLRFHHMATSPYFTLLF
jgi:hypothetical protein